MSRGAGAKKSASPRQQSTRDFIKSALGSTEREPGWEYGQILPVRARKNEEGGMEREWGLGYSNTAKGMLDAITLPRRAFEGEEVSPEQAMEMAMNVTAPGVATARYAPGVLNMPIVYHGGPHKFPPTPGNPLGEFDASKIGTGEGAQAYGHGIYVAESPAVAKQYKQKLSASGAVPNAGAETLQRYNPELYKKLEKIAIDGGYSDIAINRMVIKPTEFRQITPELKREILDFKKGYKGNLYTADLPDEMVDRMLDWDKPLSEQPEAVQKALKTAWPDIEEYSAKSGEKLYQELSMPTFKSTPTSGMNRAEAAAWLRQLGIPGIKYLDAGSRGDKAKPTRNFVLFPGEEKKAKIIKRD